MTAATQSPAVMTPFDDVNAWSLRATLHYFWWVFWAFTLGLVVTLSWDGWWHSTRVFDSAFSPPHLFGYGVATLCALLAARLAFTDHMRRWFGVGSVRVWLVPFAIPGALFVLGAGFVLLGIAGALDLTWHSAFGLDETGWSTPHSMIGCAFFLLYLGFAACRLALARHQPMRPASAFVLIVLVLLFSGIGLGPLAGNTSPAEVQQLALRPLFLREPAAEHAFRIALQWNLTRTNPLFVPLAAIWVGMALTLARRLEPRTGVYVAAVGVWSLLTVTPGPFWLAILASLGLGALRLPSWLVWGVSGALFGAAGAYVWHNPALAGLLTLVAAPLMVLGHALGDRLGGIIRDPSEQRGYLFVYLGLIIPLCTGIVDLYLRANTP